MRSRTPLALVMAALVAVALAAAAAPGRAAGDGLRLMTWNLYVGAPFELGSAPRDPAALAAAADQALAAAEASDVPARMDAVARAIGSVRPDVIALQEVVRWRVQEPGDALATPASATRIDALASLTAALRARGLAYRVAAISTNVDAEVTGASGRDVRLTDRDVVMVRAGRGAPRVGRHGAGRFARLQVVQTPFGPVPVPRGWAFADLRLGTDRLRVVSTHLDPGAARVTLAQAREIAVGPASFDGPVAVLGDVNARPGSAPYRALTRSGLRDAWAQVNGARPGSTCCHDVSLVLDDPIEERIDVVLTGNGLVARAARLVGSLPGARTPTGLWPSDHIGVAADVLLPPRSADRRARVDHALDFPPPGGSGTSEPHQEEEP